MLQFKAEMPRELSRDDKMWNTGKSDQRGGVSVEASTSILEKLGASFGFFLRSFYISDFP